METVTLKLPENLLRDAARVAHGEDVTIGHLVRHLLAKEVARRLDPRTPIRAEEGLLAALQTLLARDMAEAENWDDLATRLARHGYEFRPLGGGIVLYKISCGTRVCKGSELGVAYRTLVKQFGQPLPDHPRGAMGVDLAQMQPDAAPLDSTTKGRLQRKLGPLFKVSADWSTLISNLEGCGYTLRPMGTGLGIYSTPQGRHICNTSTVGYRYRALVKRFGAPMPGHPHGAEWVSVTSEENQPLGFQVIEND